MEVEAFGEVLRDLRKQKKLSQATLADRLDVHRNTISAWERGEWLPGTRGFIFEVARQLGLDDDESQRLLIAALFMV